MEERDASSPVCSEYFLSIWEDILREPSVCPLRSASAYISPTSSVTSSTRLRKYMPLPRMGFSSREVMAQKPSSR